MVLTIALALPHAHIAPVITMPTPLVAVALITFLRTPRGRRKELWAGLGVRRLGLRSWPVAIVVPVILILVIPFGVADLLGSAAWSSSLDVWLSRSLPLLITLVSLTIMGFTEEIGWRGYLLPRVQTMVSKRRAALVVGFIHGLFHMPLILLTTTYDSVGSRWIVAPSVMVLVTAAGVFYAWLKDRSGSVWPVAVAHGAVNTLLEGGGLVVIVSPVALAYTAGESGIATAVSVIALAAVLLIRGRTWGRN
ncbi:CAAX prenyl protease-like protein [Kribbella sp. VKM Ac-2566]|jgi:membrane protease YdiL (CAAX protease family)|nr:CAAX prenyl protease-like protein [Kribbella sp. VKM Ac-2566]